jgi:hypothetical protein
VHFNHHISTTVTLRDLRLPEDYTLIANLFNSIEPESTTLEALENEDRHIPAVSSLTLDENGLLTGFCRMRVVAENSDGASSY